MLREGKFSQVTKDSSWNNVFFISSCFRVLLIPLQEATRTLSLCWASRRPWATDLCPPAPAPWESAALLYFFYIPRISRQTLSHKRTEGRRKESWQKSVAKIQVKRLNLTGWEHLGLWLVSSHPQPVTIIRRGNPRLEVLDKWVIYCEGWPLSLCHTQHRNKKNKHSEWEELRQTGGG